MLLLSVFIIIRYLDNKKDVKMELRDYKEIVDSDTIIAVIGTNPIDYFIYHGRPMGFNLEILQDFAKSHNLTLKVIVENNLSKGIEMLMERKCDILAQDIIINTDNELIHEFTIPVRETKQVLIQRLPNNFNTLTYRQIEDSLIRNPNELNNKTIYIYKDNINKITIENLINKSVENIYVEEIDSIPAEQIIQYVSQEIFDYAICDINIAKIAKSYYPNIDIKTELSLPQNIAWGIRPESVILLDTINNWLKRFKKTYDYKKYNTRYINNNRTNLDINSEFYSGNEGKISEYDNIIKKYAYLSKLDWRLIASLIYEESRFNENIVSWAGAYGLMQLMPFIYTKFVPDTLQGVEGNIAAGAKYLSFLQTKVPANIQDSATAIKLVLAGYNVGFGHVEDAIRLAKKHNENTASWKVISYYLTNLSNPRYYNDTCVKHGYISGIYAVNFANNISQRFEHYKNVIPK